MKAMGVILGLAGLWRAFGCRQETGKPKPLMKSPLLGDGPLRQVRRPLEQIFRFTIEGATLKVDREARGTMVKEAGKGDARVARNPEALFPIEAIFSRIQ